MIKKLTYLGCFLLLVSMVGCSQINIPFMGKSDDQTKADRKSNLSDEELVANEFIEKGRIVNAQSLQQGKNVVIIPFTAGVDAYASDELDKVALTIVKGISDAFADDKNGKQNHFHILTAENANEADLIVKGHIHQMGGPSKLRRWVMLKNKNTLSVEGKITNSRTGETVVIFHDQIESKIDTSNFDRMGQQIGVNIGRFILSGVQ